MTHRSRGSGSAGGALVLVLCALAVAGSPDLRAAEASPGAAEVPSEAWTLDQAVDRALAASFGLRIARNDLASAQSGVRAAENAFDFKLVASLADGHAYQRNGRLEPIPGTVLFEDYVDENQSFTFRLQRDLELGGSVELRTDLFRQRTRDGGLDPLHQSTSSVAWTIPLWGGRGRRVATAGLVSARTGLGQQSRSLVEREMQVVVNVVRSFYQVLRAGSVLAIDRQAVERAEENRRTYDLRLQEGLVTPIDVSRAERELRGRENAVVGDEESLQAAKDALLQALALRLDTPIQCVGEPSFSRVEVELEAATVEALANRVDLRSLREDLELARLDADVARSLTRPRVDLTVSAGFSGVDGDDAGKWFDLDNDDRWLGGLGVSYTFGERSDDEALARALIAEDSLRVRLEELEREVVLDVREAVRSVKSLERQIELLEQNVDLAEESRRLAELQFQEDLIRTTDLLQIQDELVRAQTDLVNALYDHAAARVALDLALGRYRVGQEPASRFLREAPSVVPDVPVLPRTRFGEEAGP